MNPVEIGNKLGKLMADSNEYIRFKKAKEAYMADNKAKALIMKFKENQEMLSLGYNKVDNIDINRIRNELTLLYTEIENNKVIKELNEALNEFLIFKKEVYDNIESHIKIDEEILSLNNRCGCKRECGGCNR